MAWIDIDYIMYLAVILACGCKSYEVYKTQIYENYKVRLLWTEFFLLFFAVFIELLRNKLWRTYDEEEKKRRHYKEP